MSSYKIKVAAPTSIVQPQVRMKLRVNVILDHGLSDVRRRDVPLTLSDGGFGIGHCRRHRSLASPVDNQLMRVVH